jgi:hypothetical protein
VEDDEARENNNQRTSVLLLLDSWLVNKQYPPTTPVLLES